VEKLQQRASEPRPAGCRKLTDREEYRIRVGDYRILYTIDDDSRIVEVVAIVPRDRAYR
jgi:mRNA interferase RelE/StbE